MARSAIISDIHGNLEALEAVLRDIDRQGVQEIACLGDVVGYGPNPAECIDLVRSRCLFTIRGNHDEAVLQGALGFNPVAREAADWTRRTLRPRFYRPRSRERWEFLQNLPLEKEWKGYLLVHGSPRDPLSEYIMDRHILAADEVMFAEIFAAFEKVCFVGHTHMPMVFYEGLRVTYQRDIKGPFRYEGTKMIVNVGSVGQPRDRDPRACYLTLDESEDTFEYHRVPYDVEKTQEKIRGIGGLDDGLARRLGGGL